jgi:serine/threonine protein kinase
MSLDLDDDRILGALLEGKWRLVRRIGRGGMGQVFQAVHARMGIVKCVKILRPGSDDVLIKRFEREVRLAQQIRHPNVIRIDDFGVDTELDPQGVPFYIMEFVEGQSLRDVIGRGEVPVPRAANLVRQVALGVGAAHERDIIHRDLKPENVVVAAGDQVTVLDFGIAKLRSPESREDMLTLTRKGEIWATPQYMSPEQAMASTDLTAKSDIYSLGVVLFECLTGELPFQGEAARDFIIAHIQKDVPSLRKRRPELKFPEGLEELVTSMLAKRPPQRPETMKDVAHALEAWARAPSAPAPKAAASKRPPTPQGRAAQGQPGNSPGAPPAAAPTPKAARPAPRVPEPPDPTADLPRPPVARKAAGRPPRVVVVPHPPAGGPSRNFPVLGHLFVNLGEELHDHVVGRDRLTLGRKTENDVLIPDTLSSKVHAELLEEGGRFFLEDLGSRNGTFMGKRRVEGRVSLGDIESVRIGNTYLLFCRGPAKPEDHYVFCGEGHPSDRKAKFCGSCGAAVT